MKDQDEILFVVDDQNNPIDSKTRSEVHANGYWHRTSHIWIVNNSGEILVQKRSLLKDSNPGKWEPFFGGHLQPGIDYADGAIRELNEELGLEITQNDITFFTVHKAEQSHEFQGVFIYNWNGNIEQLKFQKEEIDHIEWRTRQNLYAILVEDHDSNWTEMGYEKEILDFLSHK